MEKYFSRPFQLDSGLELEFLQHTVGDVGCVVWDAALALAGYLDRLSKHRSLQGLNVLELGSGTGCVGLVTAALGGNVLLTDLADMIPLMKRNLVKNLTALSAGFARVEVFEWGTDFNHLLPEGGEGYDLVLVADCIYYRESLTALVKTLEQVSMAGHRPTEILVCYEERESEEKRNLVKDFTRLIETNFTVSKIPLDDYHDDWKCDDVHILKLFRK